MDIRRTNPKKTAMRRRAMYGGLGICLLAAIAFGVVDGALGAPTAEYEELRLGTVKRGSILREVRGPGRLIPKESRWITAETPARVERILLQPGAEVTPDTVVVELSNPDVIDAALAARLAVEVATAEKLARNMALQNQVLDQQAEQLRVEAEYESARLQEEGEASLADAQIISRIQARRSALAANQLRERIGIEKQRGVILQRAVAAQLRAEDARITQLENAATLLARQAESLIVRAGVSGVLQQVSVQEGQRIEGGGNLVLIVQPDELLAELRISESQVRDVINGQAVRVDTRNGMAKGKVIRVEPAVQAGVVVVEVEFAESLPPGTRPDMSVDGVIEIERMDDVLYVERPASGRLDSSSSIFRLQAGGEIAERVPVRFGRSSISSVEVVDGLRAGDIVVLSDNQEWEEHDRIKLQ